MPSRGRLRRWARRTAILLLSLLLVVAGVEVWVRTCDPWGVSQFRDSPRYFEELVVVQASDRIFAHKPRAEFGCRDFAIRTNALGLRGPELAVPKPADTTRVLFLGDSVTLGWGVEDQATFVRRAERELGRCNPGRRIECVNAGHMQFDTVQEAALCADLQPGLAPAAVCLVFVYNDVTLTRDAVAEFVAALQDQADHPPSLLQRTWFRLARGPLRGLDALRSFLIQVVGGEMEDQIQAEIRKAMAGDAPGWVACQSALRRIQASCRAAGIPFWVLDHAGPEQMPHVARFCAEAGIACRPFWLTREERSRPVRHSASDVHCNALGHELLLGKLRPVLREMGLATD